MMLWMLALLINLLLPPLGGCEFEFNLIEFDFNNNYTVNTKVICGTVVNDTGLSQQCN